jgi:cation diffusion facilitator family transporter
MSYQSSSLKTIIYALSANLGIAITKTIAAIITGSGAMLAESIHSFADSGNQILLFLGLKASKRKPDKKYPLGYGKSIFFWSFVVALILFSMGGLFSIYEGIHKLNSHEGLKSPSIAILVLVISIFLESASLIGCIKEVNKIKGKTPFGKWFRNSRQSELLVVLGEDIAALLGLFFALFSILLAVITGNPIFDAIGSIGIGILLVIISLFLTIKIKGFLIGQSANDEKQEEILQFLNNRPEIDKVLNLITIQLGSQIMVSVKVKMIAVESADQLIRNINACEKDMKKEISDVLWIFFEPDVND